MLAALPSVIFGQLETSQPVENMAEGIAEYSTKFNVEQEDIWKYGYPQTDGEYKYPVPEPDGDHWERLLKPLLKKDELQCDAWKEEVQNLLIFVGASFLLTTILMLNKYRKAGLFSAVVTAFLIESSKKLQSDPEDAMLAILNRIASSLDGSSNTTVIQARSSNQTPFIPTNSAVRLNVFWFLSLILSLSAVLIGIIALQWIREHRNYHGTTTKQTYAIYHMRTEALNKWYVSHIFTMLPLLLQGALVLFFIGVMEFLIPLGRKVSIPVIIVITLTFLFILLTTLLPTIQAFPLYIPYLKVHRSDAPSQCPYKSPQSQAFRSTSKVVLWLWSKLILTCIYFPIKWMQKALKRKKDTDDETEDFDDIWPIAFNDIDEAWTKKSWIEFDLAWLDIRDNYMTTSNGIHAAPTFPLHVPLYDLVLGLGTAVQEHGIEDSEKFVQTVYHCFQEISKNTHDIHHWQYPYQRHLQALVKRHLKRGTYGYLSDILDQENANLLFEENSLAFFIVMTSNRNLESIMPKIPHFHELQLRILASVVPFPAKLKREPVGQNFPFVLKFDYPLNTEWDKAVLQDFSRQWAIMLYSFFRGFTKQASENILVSSFHAHNIATAFMRGSLVRLKHAHEANIDSEAVVDSLAAIIPIIMNPLQEYMQDQTASRRPDLLFTAATAFTNYLDSRTFRSWVPRQLNSSLSDLSPVLSQYEEFTDNLENVHGQKRIRYVSPRTVIDYDSNSPDESEA